MVLLETELALKQFGRIEMNKTGCFCVPHVMGLVVLLVAVFGSATVRPVVAAIVIPDMTRAEHVSGQSPAPRWWKVSPELSQVHMTVGRGEDPRLPARSTTPASRTASFGSPVHPSVRDARPTVPGDFLVVDHGLHDLYELPVPPTGWQPPTSARLRYPSSDYGRVPRSPQPFEQQTPVIRKPFSSYQASPALSPYLHLYREDAVDGVDNYNLLVKPLLDQEESERRSGDDNE